MLTMLLLDFLTSGPVVAAALILGSLVLTSTLLEHSAEKAQRVSVAADYVEADAAAAYRHAVRVWRAATASDPFGLSADTAAAEAGMRRAHVAHVAASAAAAAAAETAEHYGRKAQRAFSGR
ncbi:hypothetical protein CJ179_38500 [Rhodococcus sp. ACS1]|nr:hypothetical protein CJ179_38500 [Rhodococcus sp. ACS1]